ncbi:MAG: phosphatase PAP2 family protein [Synechococcaceae bacterium WBB_3_034]|nr:phosphatase PAP2 family protein [Synechococcaceae bacterium WBB_3_034]
MAWRARRMARWRCGLGAGLIGGLAIAGTTRSRKLVPPEMESLFTLALVVALSRVMVRIHHASDVLGGALVGAGLGWVALAAASAVL